MAVIARCNSAAAAPLLISADAESGLQFLLDRSFTGPEPWPCTSIDQRISRKCQQMTKQTIARLWAWAGQSRLRDNPAARAA